MTYAAHAVCLNDRVKDENDVMENDPNYLQ